MLNLTRTAATTEEPGREDQTADLQDHQEKPKKTYVIESEDVPETPPPEVSSSTNLDQSDNATVKKSTFGRVRPLKLLRDRQSSSPHQSSPGETRNTGPLTITAADMTDKEIDRAIEDARQANDERFVKGDNGKVF